MKFTGKILDVSMSVNGNVNITLNINEKADMLKLYEELRDSKLSVDIKKFRKKRSLDANALLWACIGEIAHKINADKWDIYLQMLRRYGQYTYILVPPAAVERTRREWRECEVLNEVNVNGKKAVQMLCYFGSHLYDSKEFSLLLDGVVSEMIELGIQPPPSGDMRRSIEQLERMMEGCK